MHRHNDRKLATDHVDVGFSYGWGSFNNVSSLISGVSIFCIGAGLSWYHGIMGLIHPSEITSLYWVRIHHRHVLHGLLSPRTTTSELTADIVCSECFRFRYVTNVNHCIRPNALMYRGPNQCVRARTMVLNARRKYSLQPIAAPLCAVRYCVNYNVSSPYS